MAACAAQQKPAAESKPASPEPGWADDWVTSRLRDTESCGESYPGIHTYTCTDKECVDTAVFTYTTTPVRIAVEGAWSRAFFEIHTRSWSHGVWAPMERIGERELEPGVVVTEFTTDQPLEHYVERSGEGILAVIEVRREQDHPTPQPFHVNWRLPDKACVTLAFVWQPKDGDACPGDGAPLAAFHDIYCCPKECPGGICRAVRDTQKRAEIGFGRQLRFKGRTTELDPWGECILKDVAQVIREHPDPEFVEIRVHTNASGDAQTDLKLTERQALVIRDRLVTLGAPSERLRPLGFGSKEAEYQEPALNRHISFIMVHKEGDAEPRAVAPPPQ